MSVVTITYDWHNPRNPRCRSCTHYNPESYFHGRCQCNDNKVKNKDRYDNSKGCSWHRLRDYEEYIKILDNLKGD